MNTILYDQNIIAQDSLYKIKKEKSQILYDQNIIVQDSLYKIKKEKSQDPPPKKKKTRNYSKINKGDHFRFGLFFFYLARFFFQFGFSSVFLILDL
jgi:hypothetical protein